MNQLQENDLTDFDKLNFLKSFLPKEHLKVYKENFGFNKETSFDFHVFAPFCRAYAKFLLHCGSFSTYEIFTDSFNELIIKDRGYKHYKEAQNLMTNKHGCVAFLGFNCQNSLIKNKLYKISKGQFHYEHDLERLISSELKDYYGEEIDVKKQQHHGYGRSDITVNDSIALELKKGKAKRKDVYQAFEYSFDNKINEVLLIASDFDESVLEVANKLGVNCFAYHFMYEDYDIDDLYPIGFVLEKVNEIGNTCFEKIIREMDTFWISFYDPKFNFNKEYEKEYQQNVSIHNKTKEIIFSNKEMLLKQIDECNEVIK